MNKAKTIKLKFERVIPAEPGEVFDAWLDPKIPGNPWNAADKLLLNPHVDGFFYWTHGATPHYGRFTQMKRPSRIQHTWMSPFTSGQESMVTLSFKKQGPYTLMTLLHADLPNDAKGMAHKDGWEQVIERFPKQFGAPARKKK
jgi:uncharacterized protein YndB with AHSA1/START domain